ncbi:MAG TPA: phosphate uptake regulator PhoU [Candidatus Nanoarchaeia archaeon]|nr:phosphate uptake regulator PhoU [Candidatus Nanoarchaeia archaeon]
MDARKIISFGKNSSIVSLPKQWLIKHKLKKGDILNVYESKDGLMLRASNSAIKDEPKTACISADHKSLFRLKTEIVSAYLDNFNIIEVYSPELKKAAVEIKKIIHDLSGMEIINQTSTRIAAKDLMNISEISVETLIRRMDNIARSMMKDCLDCFKGNDQSDSLSQMDEEINRLCYLANRVIRGGLKDVRVANSLGVDNLKLHTDHTVTIKVESIADNVKRISRALKESKLNETWRVRLREIFLDIEKGYLDVMKAYYTNDQSIALQIEEQNSKRLLSCDKFFGGHSHKELKIELKQGICEYRNACGATTRIIEDMKTMCSGIKHIARTIIGGG